MSNRPHPYMKLTPGTSSHSGIPGSRPISNLKSQEFVKVIGSSGGLRRTFPALCGTPSRELDDLLKIYFEQHVKIKKAERQQSKKDVLPYIEELLKKINELDKRFAREVFRVGSAFSGLQVTHPDEFDFTVLFEATGCDNRNTLQTSFPSNGDVYITTSNDQLISASATRQVFKGLVTTALKSMAVPHGVVRVLHNNHGPAITLCFKISGRETSVDFAPYVNLERPALIPFHRLKIEMSVEYTHKIGAVAKRDDDVWTLSPILLEREMTCRLPGDCKLVYRLLKRISKDVWSNVNKPVVTSYIVKNIWFAEIEKNTKANYWNINNMSTAILNMTERLHQALETKHLPQFVLPDVNLLKDKNTTEIRVTKEKIKLFLHNPYAVLVKFIWPKK